MSEKEGFAPFFDHAAVYLGDLEIWVNFGGDLYDLAFASKGVDECSKIPMHKAGRKRGLDLSRYWPLGVIVEALSVLAAEPAGIDVFLKQRTGAIFWVAEPLVKDVKYCETDVEANEISKC